jgi:hypothetical protein
LIYVIENRGIGVGLFRQNREQEVLLGGRDDSENRKMFSHREHGFPTEGETGNW